MIRDSFFGALRTKIASAEKRRTKVLDEPRSLEGSLYDPIHIGVQIETLKDAIQLAKRYRSDEE